MSQSYTRPLARRWLALLMLSASVLPVASFAQDYERVAPKLPAPVEVPPPEAPALPAPVSTDQTVLVPELKGLVFVENADAVSEAGLTTEAAPNGIAAHGVKLVDNSLRAQLQPYLNNPLTRSGLEQITYLVREHYRLREHPFVEVTVPPQNVQNGVVQIIITEYRIGEVKVTGNRYFSEDHIRYLSDLERGERLTLKGLRRDIDTLNQNPFLTINAVIQPGAQTGQSDIILEATDRRPWRVYAGYDNQGVRSLGRDQWNIGVNWANAFGLGHILSYQYTRSFTGRYASHSLSHVTPLPQGHKILAYGSYATQTPSIAPGFKSEGHSGQISLRYVYNLPDSAHLKHDLQIGADFKRTDNNLEFAGFSLLETAAEIVQIPLTYDLTVVDNYGHTTVQNMLVHAPGDMSDRNTDEAIRALVPGSGANYTYNRLSVTRTTQLPEGMIWSLRGTVQTTNRNLPYSEQLGGGGIGSIRGYFPDTALGSEGVMINSELRTPAFRPSVLFGQSSGNDLLQIGVFYDYAHLSQRTPLPDIASTVKLSSFGFNVHYALGRTMDLQIEAGKQLHRAPGESTRGAEAAVILSISY